MTKIKATLRFNRLPDADLLKHLNTVYERMNGNPVFPKPPVNMAAFRTPIDTFSALVTHSPVRRKQPSTIRRPARPTRSRSGRWVDWVIPTGVTRSPS